MDADQPRAAPPAERATLRRPRARLRSRRRRRASSRSWITFTARSASAAGTTHETRIDEVEMISMLMPASASASKIAAATPGFAAHAGADDRDLGDVAVGGEALARRSRFESCVEDRLGALELVLGQRERDVGEPGDRGVLDDHVDVDPGVGERPERAAGDARLVGHARGSSPSPRPCRARCPR